MGIELYCFSISFFLALRNPFQARKVIEINIILNEEKQIMRSHLNYLSRFQSLLKCAGLKNHDNNCAIMTQREAVVIHRGIKSKDYAVGRQIYVLPFNCFSSFYPFYEAHFLRSKHQFMVGLLLDLKSRPRKMFSSLFPSASRCLINI